MFEEIINLVISRSNTVSLFSSNNDTMWFLPCSLVCRPFIHNSNIEHLSVSWPPPLLSLEYYVINVNMFIQQINTFHIRIIFLNYFWHLDVSFFSFLECLWALATGSRSQEILSFILAAISQHFFCHLSSVFKTTTISRSTNILITLFPLFIF